MRVNKRRDFIERLVWTLIQFAGGVGAADVLTGDPLSWWTPIFTGIITACKIAAAQHFGRHDDGAAIPGGVIEGPEVRP
jgi:hypothetical protein